MRDVHINQEPKILRETELLDKGKAPADMGEEDRLINAHPKIIASLIVLTQWYCIKVEARKVEVTSGKEPRKLVYRKSKIGIKRGLFDSGEQVEDNLEKKQKYMADGDNNMMEERMYDKETCDLVGIVMQPSQEP
ncbi:hypothetical protein DH2020_005991 [Rehmannia glutinosa]|uniref:Uncharacterized protein n=1 Tax=Rehmannia glutinosa TaxID=99300 RepID=A0ABR0XHM4_REHGL